MKNYTAPVAAKLAIPEKQVIVVLDLLSEGATIPFIARYRKDKTGALDEVQIQKIQEEAKFQQEFADRKLFIEKTISEQGKMTDFLQGKINEATTLNELEDIYLPYKPKRKTKAQTARENGLEPLALLLLEQKIIIAETVAQSYLNEKITDVEMALQGARDIIAEIINEDVELRAKMRKLFEQTATIQSKILTDKQEAGIKYKDYFDFYEPINKIPSHRILAIMRGFSEGFLKMAIAPEEELAFAKIEEQYIKTDNESSQQIKKAIKDAYRRLLQPSLESEFRLALKTKADEEAISVFAENLRQLLLSSPLGSKKILAIDPGYRTGCKVVVLDEKGELQKTAVIFVHEKNYKIDEAKHTIENFVKEFSVEAFAIGDGTAGRETEQFIKGLNTALPVFLVNEDGASIYSASEIGREEFPDHDITVRGAVSIGRRLMDPLAELVKIDPKSIGVGQYQHDVNQTRLKEKLDQTVVSCVNAVGVNLNTASKYLLSYVSGLGPSIAENIVNYRKEKGRFTNRQQLKQVSRLGEKAYEQCAGFLRIKNGENPLDESGVHPESYTIVEQMARDAGVEIKEIIGNEKMVKQVDSRSYINENVGLHTIDDILKELKKPGIDPREEAQAFEFANIYSIEDVKEGMIVPGQVTNLTRFGAFIDIGVKQDGLVHVSEIAHKYISDPAEVLKLNDKVLVKVTEVDLARKRIALSIKQTQQASDKRQHKQRDQRNGVSKSSHQQKVSVSESASIEDAINVLRKKFGK
ncbi:RNA-binding transcriptional accessory protein [Hanamia caeni]|uniref:RNA-binding transcriptional accessory protein n=1 Tax=Hanamia caeni TaxID=2294116 RepID=A0A3M9NJG4_9BACT|nr:Tex family protein [Hanamia caeni]RNI37457.1 RNA-binding transcriptional accessory protein [Hanamia caeni]